MAARLAPGDTVIGFAALTHDLGKALTPADELPRNVKHEQRGLAPLRALCERMKVPTAHRELALTACRAQLHLHRLHAPRDPPVHALMDRCDALLPSAEEVRVGKACVSKCRTRWAQSHEQTKDTL